MDNLLESCTALEIDLRHSGSFVPHVTPDSVWPPPYLCDSIRRVLPLLEHLRLRLPRLCPSIFCGGLQSQDADARVVVVCAPSLRTCLINLSLRKPGPLNQGAWTTECRESHHRTPHIGQLDQLPSALPAMEGVIRDFAERNDENLKRLWVMDVQPHDPTVTHGYASWIRRDFLARDSFPIPVWNMGIFSGGACAARIPSPRYPGEAEDWVSQERLLEILAEGEAWTETRISARLPTQDVKVDNKSRPLPHDDRILSAQRYREETHSTSLIWRNEDVTAQVLLPRGPGELMKRWEVVEAIPSGWRSDNFDGAPLMRIA
ncbi:hypothetical protein F4802DRAFT_574395 [Xylaria palmicola]|nr:hypothetical protein F4802DRAFT_574395 [Xylaria palmicola]